MDDSQCDGIENTHSPVFGFVASTGTGEKLSQLREDDRHQAGDLKLSSPLWLLEHAIEIVLAHSSQFNGACARYLAYDSQPRSYSGGVSRRVKLDFTNDHQANSVLLQ